MSSLPEEDKRVVIDILRNVMYDRCGVYVDDIILDIYKRAFTKCVGRGTSTYARRRRAQSISRCERCYRVYPTFWFTKKCDNRTCVPGISSNMKVVHFIRWGVTEVIPCPEQNDK